MLLEGASQMTSREQAWDRAAQSVRAWLDRHGQEGQAGEKNQPWWITVPRWKLNRALRRLPPGYRRVFEMHERLGYTHSDIADSLDCSVGTSKSQLHKARRRLRQLLQRKRPSEHEA